MDATSLDATLAALSPAQRRRAIAFLLSLERTDEERRELARKIDDNDPSHWVKGEDLNRVLGLEDREK